MSGYFGFNPITGRLDLDGNTGGGGGGDITLTSQDGIPNTGSSFNFNGMAAASAPVISSSNIDSTFIFENRAWETQYIVDQNTTPGLRGTYSTLQSALDAAKADGMTFQNPKKILIRFNNTTSQWVEDLNIWSGAYFACDAIGAPIGGAFIPPATIKGNHILESIGVFYSQGVNWESATDGIPLFSGGEAITSICAADSVFSSVFADGSILETAGNFNGYFQNCDFNGNADTLNVFDCPSVGSLIFQTCNFNAISMAFGGSSPIFKNCSDIGCITMADFPVYAYDSTFVTTKNNISCVNQNSGLFSEFYNCKFTGNGPGQYALDAPGITGYFSNCAITGISQSLEGFYSPGTIVGNGHNTAGNVLFGIKIDSNTTLDGSESYVGVLGNASAIQIQLRQSIADYQVWICDESGTAATLPITITDVNGGTINGLSTYVINQNFGGALLRSIDGVNWSVIANATPGASSSFKQIVQRTFSSSATYTPTPGMKYCEIKMVGGGGGSGGAATTGPGQIACGGGGGGGAYSVGVFSAAQIGASISVTIGAGGTAGSIAGSAGGTGGTTSITGLISAGGGTGGGGGVAASISNASAGAGGNAGGPAPLFGGESGTGSIGSFSAGFIIPGNGGSSYFGGRTVSPIIGVGAGSYPGVSPSANSRGCGASGSAVGENTTGIAGAVGSAAYVLITEYI